MVSIHHNSQISMLINGFKGVKETPLYTQAVKGHLESGMWNPVKRLGEVRETTTQGLARGSSIDKVLERKTMQGLSSQAESPC